MRRPGRTAALLLAAAVGLAACSSSASTTGTTAPAATRTVVRTHQVSSPGADYRPPPARFVRPLPPGHRTPGGAKDARCPYIRTGLDEDGDRGYHLHRPNVADIEGDRIYRTTVLTHLHPVGCRFYFYAPPYEAVADVVPRRFSSATVAHNALVRTAEAGSQPISAPHFARDGAADRVDGISYRTKFFDRDGTRDWAFAFAAGRTLVVVHTQRSDTSRPAVYLARAIVGRF
ncbi:hypothetical protein [Jatrophihabitans endophyticus]|uniref:hypothetical protein n=1 Tax=Jatrophihabitans endophyticus TaxID=1206085 RepID=UPI0019EEA347|nr:hypothetical protein [Jatrophihabitans endophyticus]MBE7189606.1 hypothetical protein [Jatrophihabitans endophyticus]